MLELNELLTLLDKVNELSYDEFEMEHGSLKIKVKKSNNETNTKKVITKAEPTQMVKKIEEVTAIEEKSVVEQSIKKEEYKTIISPMVGTFYSRSNPESNDFVKVGDKVSKNTTVCIVEAMKLFNEIQAEMDAEIVEVLAQNGQLVEYGQPLFSIR